MSRSLRILLKTILVLAALLALAAAVLSALGLHDQMGKADVGLVLGNQVELDGTPSARLRARLDRTLELYRDGAFPLIIVSGGIDPHGHDEAAVMRQYLMERSVPAEHIIADAQGVNTWASAENTVRVIQERKLSSVFVVSQYFHLPRARQALHRVGITEVYSAHARYFEWRDCYSAPREVIGYVSYLWRTVRPRPA